MHQVNNTAGFPGLTPKKRLIVFMVVVLATMMLGFQDMGLMNSLTTIRTDLNMNLAVMQWLLTLYLTCAAITIVPGGRYSDYYGRFSTYSVALFFFIVGTILCSIGTNSWLLVIGRVIVGLSSASLAIGGAILNAVFPKQSRNTVLILWNGSLMLMNALAPFFGGLFSQYGNWRLLFWISLGCMTVCFLLSLWLRRFEKVVGKKIPVDYIGCLLLTIVLVAFVLIFSEGAQWGWTSAAIITLYAVCPGFLFVFIVWEHFYKAPLMPIYLFKKPSFVLGIIIIFLSQMAWTPMAYLYLQYVSSVFGLNYSVFVAGATFIPFGITAFFISLVSGRLFLHFKPKYAIVFGAACLFAGLLTMSFIGESTGYVNIWWRLVLCGLGVAFPWLASLPIALSDVPVALSGMATGTYEVFRYVGMVVGIGIGSSVYLTDIKRHADLLLIPKGFSQKAIQSLIYLGHTVPSHAMHAVRDSKLPLYDALKTIFNHAFHSSMVYCYICAAIVLALSILYCLSDSSSMKSNEVA